MKKVKRNRKNVLIFPLNEYRQKLMSSNEVKALFNLMVEHLENEKTNNIDPGVFGFLLYSICKEYPEKKEDLLANIYNTLAALQVEGEIDLLNDITEIIQTLKEGGEA